MRKKKKYPKRPPVDIGEVYTHGCRHCGGSRQEPGLTDLTCRECMGRGRRKWRIEECKACGGSGRADKLFGLFKCQECQSRGWTMRDIG